jgi:hypothetical protein
MEFIEPGLVAPLSSDSLQLGMRGFAEALLRAAAETLALAGLNAGEVGSVILVGKPPGKAAVRQRSPLSSSKA